MIAASQGNISVLIMLVNMKADPKISDYNNLKAIDYARKRNSSEWVKHFDQHVQNTLTYLIVIFTIGV